MNPQTPQPWDRLAAAARRAPADSRDPAAPYGFATRVTARAFALPLPSAQGLLERLALRGLVVAGVLGLAAAGYGYTTLTAEQETDLLTTDIVTEVLAQS